MDIVVIRRLKTSSGCGIAECKKALMLCNNREGVAFEYLRLKSSAVRRRKMVDGKLVSWSDDDYVSEAKRRYFHDVMVGGKDA